MTLALLLLAIPRSGQARDAERHRGLDLSLSSGFTGCTDQFCATYDPAAYFRIGAMYRIVPYFGFGAHMGFQFFKPDKRARPWAEFGWSTILGPEILVGGPAFIFSDMLDAMYRDGPLATLAAAAGATLVVLLLGVRRLAGPTLFCGALGTLSMVAIASLVGVKVNFLDFVALPITIGVGIDYAVNIAVRARQEPRLERVVGATGSAVLIESYTTTVGYGSLLLSRNRGIHSFGLAA
ncbi:MAG: MMPL family transporter, partial [Myxococcota bacterium]|nr:MMPL family transporter [Myxococcota bacterium]